jgi:nitroreductase
LKQHDSRQLQPTAISTNYYLYSWQETELMRIYDHAWFVQAPMIICACEIPNKAWIRRDDKNYTDVDVAISIDHLILAATGLGLGTCWIVTFDPIATREVLKLPNFGEPVAFTPLGYASDQVCQKRRKVLTEIVKHEHWSD